MAKGGRKKSGRLFIVLALVLILILAVVAFLMRDRILSPAPQTANGEPVLVQQPEETVDIVVLTQPVTRGDAISDDMLEMIPYPKEDMREGLFITSRQDVAGKFAKTDLVNGMPLTMNSLTEIPLGSYASAQIPAGMVAISMPISKLTSVSYGLQPGDHVNIIASFNLVDLDADYQSILPNLNTVVNAPGAVSRTATGETDETTITTNTITVDIAGAGSPVGRIEIDPALGETGPLYVIPSEAQRPRLVTQSIVQDAIVLWVGDFPLDGNIFSDAPVVVTDEAAEDPAAVAPVDTNVPANITLIVLPQDAVALNYLMLSKAELSLALRSTGDEQQADTQAVTLQFIMDQYNIPYPTKLPYGMEKPADDFGFDTMERQNAPVPAPAPVQ
ncbi:MAG: Flp pilus assembly protein CpaB [Anaerolineaceae bacterium]|jgi:pilus assembly protein CpaB|nr:Flp pilus assembly protein CpaB [Anaerolineaceae bacterium]